MVHPEETWRRVQLAFGRRLFPAADELDPAAELVDELSQEFASRVVGKTASLVEEARGAANVGLRLLQGEDVEEHQHLPEMVIRAKTADRSRRDADDSPRLSIPYAVFPRTR